MAWTGRLKVAAGTTGGTGWTLTASPDKAADECVISGELELLTDAPSYSGFVTL